MAWPINKPDSNAFASDNNSIAQSRPELKTMSDAVNDIVNFVDTSGIQNGDVLVYDSVSGTIKPGTNYQLLNISAGDNITVDQDSTGGVIISSTASGLGNPLTEDLNVNGFSFVDDADSAEFAGLKMKLTKEVGLEFTPTGTDSADDPNAPANSEVEIINHGGVLTLLNDYNPDKPQIRLYEHGISISSKTDPDSGGNNGHGIQLDNSNIPGLRITSGRYKDIQLAVSQDQTQEENAIVFGTYSTGSVFVPSYRFPLGDSPSPDYVLTSDGAGTLSWAPPTFNLAEGDNISIGFDSGLGKNIGLRNPLNQTVNCNFQSFINPNLEGYTETINTITTDSAGSINVDVRDGNIQRLILTESVTFTGFAGAANGQSVTLILEQDNTGNRTFTDGTDSANRMIFAGGTNTLSTASGAVDIMTILFADGTYYASLSTNYS